MQSYQSERGAIPTTKPLTYLVFVVLAVCSSQILAQAAPAAPKVDFLQLKESKVRQWNDFSARISAVESVEVRPLVGGRIENVLFSEGQDVAQGQPLFTIDPRPFEAAVKKAEAALATANAHARLTAQELARSQDLISSKLISQSVFDQEHTDNQVAQASVLQAESSLLEAQLNLEYAHITAPIAGRVGRAELTAGNVVGGGASAPVLTTIVARDRVYAEFRVDERTYLTFTHTLSASSQMPVQLVLGDEQRTLYKGYVLAFDNHLDAASGTIRTRAVFDNTDNRLVPGMYVSVRLGSAKTRNSLLIPERAIGTNQDRKFVYVIDDANIAQYREISLGKQHQGLRIVNDGLQVGERVVINGLARLRPNTPVDPVASQASKNIAAIEY